MLSSKNSNIKQHLFRNSASFDNDNINETESNSENDSEKLLQTNKTKRKQQQLNDANFKSSNNTNSKKSKINYLNQQRAKDIRVDYRPQINRITYYDDILDCLSTYPLNTILNAHCNLLLTFRI